jgi:ubiquitin carboxyl-terminal hydrolase 1
MNNRQDWAYNSPYPRSLYQQSSEDSTAVTRVTTTIALLALGYYALSFFELWPSTIQRRAYETFLDLFPALLLVIMQSVMTRVSVLGRDGVRFKLDDLSSRQAKSEALRQLLGFENSRITTAMRKARTFSGIDNILPPSTEIGPAGLGNWDNSCYQNSVLHGFASLAAFNTFVSKSWDLMRQKDTTQAPTHEALVSFLSKLNASDQPKKILWTPAVLKSMDSWQQQDAQEYFSRVLDAVEKEDMKFYKSQKRKDGLEKTPMAQIDAVDSALNGTTGSEITAVSESTVMPDDQVLQKNLAEEEKPSDRFAGLPERNPLDGMLAQSLKCRACGFTEGLSLTQFNCITVNLGTAGGSCTLEQLLDEYTELEDIDGVECTQCTKIANSQPKVVEEVPISTPVANSDVDTDQTTASAEPPPRIKEPAMDKPPRKKPKTVLSTKSKQLTIGRLPQDLVIHLNRSIFDLYGNQRKNTALVDFPLRLSILNRWCAPLDDVDGRTIQASYALKCVVTHAGRHDDGHYIAYAKRDKDWYCFNDEVVTKVSEEFVFNRGNAFMLFYEVDDSPISTKGVTAPAEIKEDIFEDTRVPSFIEKHDLENISAESGIVNAEPKFTEATAKAQVPVPASNFLLTPPPPTATTCTPERSDDEATQSSATTSDADSEDKSQPEARLEALLPPMRTASESPTLHQRMEPSHAAPVF